MIPPPAATGPFRCRWRSLCLPILFAAVAVLITLDLYGRARVLLERGGWRPVPVPPGMANPVDPAFPLLLYNVALVLLITLTYALLQVRTGVIEARRRLDTEKCMFVRLAADSLRTPLTSVRWVLELLLAEDLGPLNRAQRKDVRAAHASLERLTASANELLKVMKLSGGLIIYRATRVDLGDILDAAARNVGAFAALRQITLSVDRPRRSDVLADPPLIQHALEILLGNALHRSPRNSTVTTCVALRGREVIVTIRYPARETASSPAYRKPRCPPELLKAEEESDGPLSLSLSREILFAARGWIRTRKVGTIRVFDVALPRGAGSPPRGPHPPIPFSQSRP